MRNAMALVLLKSIRKYQSFKWTNVYLLLKLNVLINEVSLTTSNNLLKGFLLFLSTQD